jgi:uncharacterized membrane protein (DUF2068 family)
MSNSVDQMDRTPVDLDRLERLKKRPRGVSVIAVLYFGGAALMTVAFAASLLSGSPNGADIVVTLAYIVIGVVIGVGLWKLKKWAYWLAVAGNSWNILASLLSLAAPTASVGFTVVKIGVAAAYISYLLRPAVRAAFD